MSPFAAIAEPHRRQVLDLLSVEPRTVGTLVQALGLSQPAVSKHLRILRESGLVTVRPEGQNRWYEVRPEPLEELDQWLAPYREAWAKRLDRLEQHLDHNARQSRRRTRRNE